MCAYIDYCGNDKRLRFKRRNQQRFVSNICHKTFTYTKFRKEGHIRDINFEHLNHLPFHYLICDRWQPLYL